MNQLSELSDENLLRFYIQSIYKVRKFVAENKTFVVENVDEIENEVVNRSKKSKKYLNYCTQLNIQNHPSSQT